jgi:ubiquitin-hydrolase Zn-finger-containing protein
MADTCTHLDTVPGAAPVADGCVECLQMGSTWVHLRRCTTCGHIGCCDTSPNQHATAHWHATDHPLVQSFEPGEDWYWCYADELGFEVPDQHVSYSHS